MRLENEDDQTSVLTSIINLDLNVRQTESLINSFLSKTAPQTKPPKRMSPEMIALQNSFRERLSTRVDVQKSGEGGKIVIHYFSDEELNTIYDVIIGEDDK